MNIDRIVYETLAAAEGRSLTLRKIALHTCNASRTLFGSADYREVYSQVSQTLQRMAKDDTSPVVRGAKRGEYRLDLNSQQGRHLFLQFAEEQTEDGEEPQADVDDARSLSLF